MATNDSPYWIYFASMLVIWLVYMLIRVRKHTRNQKLLRQVVQHKLTEPVSLHPVINTNRCIGCQACVYACPEREYGPVLGLIKGKAALIKASECIGHGACYTSCPVDAITLVFGTAQRGVDIPHVKPNFETNLPGVLVAGELGGMGLVRNAFNQGRQAIESIQQMIQAGSSDADLDVVIVGAGPAGIAASLSAKKNNLKFRTVEKDTLGGSITHYPRNKVVMEFPADLPLVGRMDLRVATKQEFLKKLKKIVNANELNIGFNEKVVKVNLLPDKKAGFSITTTRKTYRTKTVLLAIGRRGSPRRLDIPGEELPKVVYKLNESEQYQGKHVLVVGGGDSALEAADDLASQPDTTVTLSYRQNEFGRAREFNRTRILDAEKEKRLSILYQSNLTEIQENRVMLDHKGTRVEVLNDAVIVCAGGEMPTTFLRDVGVRLETRYGTPI